MFQRNTNKKFFVCLTNTRNIIPLFHKKVISDNPLFHKKVISDDPLQEIYPNLDRQCKNECFMRIK